MKFDLIKHTERCNDSKKFNNFCNTFVLIIKNLGVLRLGKHEDMPHENFKIVDSGITAYGRDKKIMPFPMDFKMI
jgi:hypothetical protein